jgi:hypothetical protein
MDEVYFLASILGQYVLLIAIYRDTATCKEAITTLKEWKTDISEKFGMIEIQHAQNHGSHNK